MTRGHSRKGPGSMAGQLRNRGTWRRRLLTATVAFAYVGAIGGLPLPAPSTGETGRPFPCQGHACGCRNAEQCWRHCCCYTMREKIAWAQGHRVQPPAYVDYSTGWQDVRLRDQEACDLGSCPCRQARQTSTRPQSPSRDAAKLAIGIWPCHGTSDDWLSAEPATTPPAGVCWSPLWPLIDRLVDAGTPACGFDSSPPDPPPRLV
jgi:hypothetical protein